MLGLIAGFLIVGLVLFDVFESVVVPRGAARTARIAPLFFDGFWPMWRRIGFRFQSMERRENYLGTFGPLMLMVVLAVWVLALVFGYALILYALRDQLRPAIGHFDTALYLAGVGLLTIGFGDIVPVETPARFVLLLAGASGLAVVALVISLLFTLYDNFQRREVMVLTLDARAGSPPSGLALLETYARFNMLSELPQTFSQWEKWTAEVLESHRAYPILPYFRSSHNNTSWVSSLGAVLDAATLLMTTVEDVPEKAVMPQNVPHLRGTAHMVYRLGCHAVLDLGHWFCLAEGDSPGVEKIEFELARRRLERAGFTLQPLEKSWEEFAKLRSVYAVPLNALARNFATPPAHWIGDRSTLSIQQGHLQRPAEPRRRVFRRAGVSRQ